MGELVRVLSGALRHVVAPPTAAWGHTGGAGSRYLHDTAMPFARKVCAALRCAVLCCAVLCCAVLCCAVLCCAVLCCAVLCCAVAPCSPGVVLRRLDSLCHIACNLLAHEGLAVVLNVA
jgi:hypothetical protein